LAAGAIPQFRQHLVGRNEKWIFLQNPADDDHGVRPQDIHHNLSTKLVQIVCSTDGVIVSRKDIIEPRFVLDDIVHTRTVFERPLHVCHQTREWKPLCFTTLEHLFDQRQHAILIEVAVSQVGVFPAPNLELPPPFGIFDVYSSVGQVAAMLWTMRVLNHVKRPITVVKTLLDERKQDAILLVLVMEERANVARATKRRTCQLDRFSLVVHERSPSNVRKMLRSSLRAELKAKIFTLT
jgi:hypothetical protein